MQPAPRPLPPTPNRGPGAAVVPGRRLAPDLARGLMLLLIALANVSWYLYGHAPGPVGPHPAPAGTLDAVIQVVMLTFVDGRAFPLFSFLFAYGMVQFYTSRRARGLSDPVVRSMLNRRHWAMLVIGFLHAALLFVGDVVGAYALAGLLIGALFFFRRTPTLKTWAVLGVVVLGLIGVVSLGVGILFEVNQLGTPAAAAPTSTADDTAGQANYLVAMVWRLGLWAGVSLFSGLVLPIPLLMLVGWLAARVRLLEDVATHRRRLVTIAAWTLPIGWAFGLAEGLQQVGVVTFSHAPWMFTMINMLAGMGTGIGYACLFALLGARWEARPPRLVLAVAAVGQRSLSSYLWQSLLFAPLLSAWGLALGNDIGTWQAMLLALAVWLSSVVICDQLGRRGLRGPAEAVLRRITYGKYRQLAAGSAPPPVLSPAVRPARPGQPTAPPPHPGFRPPPGRR